MSIQENKQLVIEAYKLYQKGDIAALLERYHDDVEWVGPESEYLPYAGSYHGKQGVAQFFTKLGQSVQALKFEPRQFIAEGEQVVVTGVATWQVKTTGITYDSPWVHVISLRDGKVARFESYFDTGPAERAFQPALAGALGAAKPLHH